MQIHRRPFPEDVVEQLVGRMAFITAVRSPALSTLPMLLTTSGGIVSAYWRGTPGAEVWPWLNRSSPITCLHSS
ncbi:hypothetical protein [Saccharopolyspora taberi]|uniref:hypothetical protein n=1 Tax=Saccharopolyspora taberi TaxID=60895 RepID=UPI0031DECE79